ncbi:unnamed protein product [Moneuplotes crassus]|uniref:Uncharacterized protein n=1 Tax=Euplotes crassus TaxID=5936 RepID=A0AAD1U3D8_EUPCR|nr:unnamed protein product [Moneuplotes crassus]
MLNCLEFQKRMNCQFIGCINQREHYCEIHEQVICGSCLNNHHYDCENPEAPREDGKKVVRILHKDKVKELIQNIDMAFTPFFHQKKKGNMELVEDFSNRLKKFEMDWDHLKQDTMQVLRADDFLKYKDCENRIKMFFQKFKRSDLYKEFAIDQLNKLIQNGCSELDQKCFKKMKDDLEQEYCDLRKKLYIENQARIQKFEREKEKLIASSNNKEILEENEQFKNEEKVLKSEIRKLNIEINKRSSEEEKLKKTNSELSAQIGRLKEKVQEITAEKERMNVGLKKVKEQLEEEVLEKKRVMQSVGDITKEKDKIEKEFRKAEKEAEDLQERIKKLEDKPKKVSMDLPKIDEDTIDLQFNDKDYSSNNQYQPSRNTNHSSEDSSSFINLPPSDFVSRNDSANMPLTHNYNPSRTYLTSLKKENNVKRSASRKRSCSRKNRYKHITTAAMYQNPTKNLKIPSKIIQFPKQK